MAMQKGSILNTVFDRLKNAIDVVERLIDGGCAKHPEFGVVTSCPTVIFLFIFYKLVIIIFLFLFFTN